MAALLAGLPLALTTQAQTANTTYYTGACQLEADASSTFLTLGNLLCYSGGNYNDTNPSSTQTDIAYENTRTGTYFTMVIEAEEAGTYGIVVEAAVKSGSASANVTMLQSTGSYDAPSNGDTDADVSYVEVATKSMPENSSWTNYSDLTFYVSLNEGINYVKLLFTVLSGSYAGNIGTMEIVPYVESDEPELMSLSVGGSDVLSAMTDNGDGTYSCDYTVSSGQTSWPEVEVEANSAASYAVSYSSDDYAINETISVALSNSSTGEEVAIYIITIRGYGYNKYYTGALPVDTVSTGEVIVGNFLSYYLPGEFAQSGSASSTNLEIGNTYSGYYYTFILDVDYAGEYDINIFGACKNEAYLELYQSTDEIASAPLLGENDEQIAYTLVDTQQMPLTSSWTAYEELTYDITLNKGINYIRIKFVDTSSYGGNIGYITIERDVPLAPSLKTLTIDGSDILDYMADDYTYIYSLPAGTSYIPTVAATANELATCEITQATEDNLEATVLVYETATSELVATYTIVFEYVNTVSGYSFTWTVDDGTTTTLDDETKYTYVRVSETNAAFSIKGVANVYSDNRFKTGMDKEYALCVPANAIVETVTFYNCYDNYADAAEITIASSGATISVSPSTTITNSSQNIVATLTNHQAGTPITFSFSGGSQACFEQVIIEYAQVNDGTVNLLSTSIAEGEEAAISGSITLTFDREVSLANGAVATIDGQEVRIQLSGSSVIAYYWDFDYATEHTLVFPANSVYDIFNNYYGEAITINFSTEEKPEVAMETFDYVVSTVSELQSAITQANSINTSEDSERIRILILDGEYVLTEESAATGTTISAYNVSLIGQSMEGTILTSASVNPSMSNPTVLVSNQGVYFQDLTIRTSDYRTEQWLSSQTSYGTVIALRINGQKTILKRISLESNQDTYLTGHRSYHEDCDIHGTVDFICGGGDNFFSQCNLILENRKGNVIVAPSTASNHQWGYVFDGSTISAAGSLVVDGNYNLGRPWQNEPRAYYLNTTMNVVPSDNGWGSMSSLTTHFYEYNSVDGDGNTIDLSVRGNSSTSTNTYTPVLSDDEAAEFTVNNVVGGTDGWMPASHTVQVDAPVVTISDGTLSWNAVSDALCYVVFADGEYVATTTDTTYEIGTTTATITVRAANEMGGLGDEATATVSTAIQTIDSSADPADDAIYSIQGIRMENSSKGLYIQGGKKIIIK